jgi:hypothetical protein
MSAACSIRAGSGCMTDRGGMRADEGKYGYSMNSSSG